MLSISRAEELGKLLEKVLARHPEADRETVWRILRDLEQAPMERLRRGLKLGPYSLSRRLR